MADLLLIRQLLPIACLSSGASLSAMSAVREDRDHPGLAALDGRAGGTIESRDAGSLESARATQADDRLVSSSSRSNR